MARQTVADNPVETDPATPGAVTAAGPMNVVPRAAARGVAWMGMEKWVDHAVSIGVFVLLGRLLRPVDFGVVAAASVVLWFLRVIVDQGFSRALVQRAELSPEHVDTAFWTALATGVVFAALTCLAAPLIALLFSQPQLTIVVRVLSVVFIFSALDSTQSALVEREMAFRVQAVRRIVATAVSAGLAVGLAVAGAGVWALVGQGVALEAVTVALLWSLVPWRPSRRFSRRCFGELFSFGTRYSGIRVLWFLSANADDFLVGVVLGPVALGYYVVGYRALTVLGEVLSLAIDNVSLTTFSRLRPDPALLHRAFYRALGMVCAFGFPMFAGLAIVANRFVPVVFGSRWAPAVPVMQVLAAAGLAQCAVSVLHNFVVSLGRVQNELRWTAVTTAAQVAAFGATVHFGIVAVAAGSAAATVLAWPVRLAMVGRWSGISARACARQYLGPALATIVMSIAVLTVGTRWDGGRAWVMVAEILTGLVVYPTVLLILAPSVLRDVLGVVRLVRRDRLA